MTQKLLIWGGRFLWAAVFFAGYYFLFEFQYKWYRSEAISGMLSLWMVTVFASVIAGLIFVEKLRWVWAFAFVAFWVPMLFLWKSTGWAWLLFGGVVALCAISAFVFPRKLSKLV